MAKRKVVGYDESNSRLAVPGPGDVYSVEKDIEMTAGVTIGGVKRTAWPSPGNSTVGIDDVLNNGDVTTRRVTLGGVDFAAVSSLMLPLTIVDYDYFDNSKDPTWIEKCSDKSWENETVYTGDQYLGATYANDAAALAANPSIVADDIYYNGTDFVLYSTGTVINRASQRKMPMTGFDTIEAGRWIRWDTTGGTPKMWRVFKMPSYGNNPWAGTANLSSIVVLGPYVMIGVIANTNRLQTFEIDFFADSLLGRRRSFYNGSHFVGSSVVTTVLTDNGQQNGIVADGVNDVAMMYANDAPLNSFGMRVPTRVVGCATGASVIQNTGSVASDTTPAAVNHVDFVDDNTAVFGVGTGVTEYVVVTGNINSKTGSSLDNFGLQNGGGRWYRNDSPILPLFNAGAVFNSVSSVGGNIAVGTAIGLAIVVENPTDPAKGMVANVTSLSNTGYMVGDIRRAIGYDSASALADKSVKAGAPVEIGTLIKTPHAGGRTVVSGFANGNYLHEASHADFNALGTQFSVIIPGLKWGTSGVARSIISLVNSGTPLAGDWQITTNTANNLVVSTHDGTNWGIRITTATAFTDLDQHELELKYDGATLSLLVDGDVVGSAAHTASLSSSAPLRIGNNSYGNVWAGGSFEGYIRISATTTSPEQSEFIAVQENALNGGKPCLLSSADSVVKEAKHSDVHGVQYVKGNLVVDEFKGLVRNDYMVMATGVTNSGNPLAAPYLSRSGTINYWKAPAIDVNSQLKALALENAELRQKSEPFGFNGDTVTVEFRLPRGFKPQTVYVAGLRKFKGSTSDYTIGFDKFIYSVVFAVAPATGTNNVVVEGVRV